ncbi:MAG TPA: AmmeMemoRadiSam system radical SAM enzyme [Bacteroidales bacterium]|nr:AmmeMemoRadiSam system radical SAM enzyme [Bacteroidales bacterium]HPS16230.1 AmmeMemoRadiSam system radical SAM enzyme [Bacteroidales bacterium]
MINRQLATDEQKKITKRDFLKKSLLGFGGMTACLSCTPLLSLANTRNSMTVTKRNDDITDLLKHSKEALYYESLPGKYTQCHLCPHACKLANGGRSFCRNKFNVEGKYYTIAYGNPCTYHIDPIEKKPLFHFFPQSEIFSLSTAGCNFRCLNCQNWTISQVGPDKTENENFSPEDIIKYCKKNSINSIAYTYAEPIAYYEYMLEIAKQANAAGIKNVFISNGYINEEPLNELSKYIDAASINLKSFQDSIYQDLNGGTLQPVLNTLLTLKKNSVWLEIINLIVPTWTDNMTMIKEMCQWLNKNGFNETPLHFSRFTPMYKLTNLPYTPVATLEEAIKTAIGEGLKYVYIGNVPGNEAENTFCPGCSKKIISRKGFKVIENHIKNGNCEYCSTAIAGIWE